MTRVFQAKPAAPMIAQAQEHVKPKDPAPMPDPDSTAAREAARLQQMRMMQRGGRSSTILTGREDRQQWNSTRLGSGA